MRCCVLVLLVEAACLVPEDDGPPRIVDQSGAEFFWACDNSDYCTTHRIAGVSPPLPDCGDAALPFYRVAWQRFLAIYGSCEPWVPASEQTRLETARLVVCKHDRDCPEGAYFDPVFECRNGFCQNVDVDEYAEVQLRELFALCFGDEPRFTPTERPPDLEAAVLEACPGGPEDWNAVCSSIPPECADPGPPR